MLGSQSSISSYARTSAASRRRATSSKLGLSRRISAVWWPVIAVHFKEQGCVAEQLASCTWMSETNMTETKLSNSHGPSSHLPWLVTQQCVWAMQVPMLPRSGLGMAPQCFPEHGEMQRALSFGCRSEGVSTASANTQPSENLLALTQA